MNSSLVMSSVPLIVIWSKALELNRNRITETEAGTDNKDGANDGQSGDQNGDANTGTPAE